MAEEVVLAPDKQYTAQSYGATTRVGATTDQGALADELDTSYLTTSFGLASGNAGNYIRRYWGFATPTIPAGAIVEYLRAEWRALMPPNSDNREGLAWSQANVGINQGSSYALSDATVFPALDDNVIRSYATPNVAKDASGRPWQAFGVLSGLVVAITARVEERSSDLNDPRLYRVRLALAYNERPVVSTVGPAGTVGNSRPTITWSYSDPENDPQQAYQVKVFTSAQSNPAVAGAVYDSGRVLSSRTAHPLPKFLANNTTHYVYVQVEQPPVAGSVMRSLWASGSFTVAIPAPVAPSVSATVEASLGRHRVVMTEQGLPAAERYSVEHSLDGVTWQPVRGATEVAFPGTGAASVTVYDYEVPLGVSPRYRARIVDVLAGGEEYSSSWSTSPAIAAAPTDRYWLKDLVNPALNYSPRVASWSLSRPRPEQRSYGVGSDVAAVSHDGRRGFEGSIPFRTTSRQEYAMLDALLDTGRTLLLQDPQGRQAYMSFGQASYELRVTQSDGSSPVGHFHDITVAAIEVARPQG